MLRTSATFILIPFLLLTGCGSDPETPDTTEPEQGSGPVLTEVSRIGIELGDSNYVFGAIQDVDFTPEGNLVVLDAQKMKVSAFTPSGEFLGSFGGAGEGPGEFLNPRSIACLEDGRIAVSDPFSREVEIFNPDFSHSETVANFTERAPFVIAATETGFTGEQGGFSRESGIMTTRIVSWNLDDGSTAVHFEREDVFSPENMMVRFMQPQAGIAASGSGIYYSPPVTDEYMVHRYSWDGSPAAVLSIEDYSPVRKTDQEIQNDIQAYEERLQAMLSSGRGSRFAEMDYTPEEDYYATASMGIDSDGTVWVQRGWETPPVFDLFQDGSTEPSGVVITDPTLNLDDYTFSISPFGTAAYHPDPEDYPYVVILTLEQ